MLLRNNDDDIKTTPPTQYVIGSFFQSKGAVLPSLHNHLISHGIFRIKQVFKQSTLHGRITTHFLIKSL